MSSDIRAKFNEWIVIFVLLPAALSMTICIFFFWRLLSQNHQRMLADQVTAAGSSLEQTLHAESLRLRTLMNLPATESLVTIAHRRSAGASLAESKTETEWITATRDDLMVRTILDNDIGILFRQTCDQYAHIKSLLLTDQNGALIAASEKTPVFSQSQSDWWPLLRQAKKNQVLSEAATQSGSLGLILPHMANGSLSAVARAELSIPRLIDALAEVNKDTNVADIVVYLVGQDARILSGPVSPEASDAGTMLARYINETGISAGWREGVRFNGRRLDAGIIWARPLWVVAAHAESVLPLSLYGPLALAAVIGCAAVFGIFVFSRNIGSRLFFEPMREAAEAGVWVLRHASNRAGQLAEETGRAGGPSIAATHPWSRLEYDEDTPLHQELNRWFDEVRHTPAPEVVKINTEIRSDVTLAGELQKVLMARPIPSIPEAFAEGRLRLEFCAAYKPSRDMGGDFYDVRPLANDCAGVFIGDVMGHGTRSALLTAALRSLIHENAKHARHPAQFLKEINRMFCDMLHGLDGQYFATACYFTADLATRSGTFSTAGHAPPFHLHRNVGRVIRLEKPKPRGAALGVIPEEEFGAETVRLVDGDMFVFFTDGIYEATARDGESFGLARLEKSLQSHIYDKPATLLGNVLEDLQKFLAGEPLSDDVCMVGVYVTSKPQEKT